MKEEKSLVGLVKPTIFKYLNNKTNFTTLKYCLVGFFHSTITLFSLLIALTNNGVQTNNRK
jgi:hypothetical protein